MDLEVLKLAFAAGMAERIVEADGVEDAAELQAFGELISPLAMRQAGFVDADGAFTEAFRAAFLQAEQSLKDALSPQEKLDLLTVLFGIEQADASLDPREMAILREAASTLGVPDERLLTLLHKLMD